MYNLFAYFLLLELSDDWGWILDGVFEDTKGNLLKQNQRHEEVSLTIGMTCFREAAEFPWV